MVHEAIKYYHFSQTSKYYKNLIKIELSDFLKINNNAKRFSGYEQNYIKNSI